MPGYSAKKRKRKKKKAAPIVEKCGLFSFSANRRACQPSIYGADKYIQQDFCNSEAKKHHCTNFLFFQLLLQPRKWHKVTKASMNV